MAGRDHRAAHREPVRRVAPPDTIGFIFQSYNLIPFLSAVENVELPLMFEPYRPEVVAQAGVGACWTWSASAIASTISQTKMSGGEQQRVAVARALISQPSVIFADEPTANLDRRSGSEVLQILTDLCASSQLAVIASTHDPIVAQEATRVFTIEDGQLINA